MRNARSALGWVVLVVERGELRSVEPRVSMSGLVDTAFPGPTTASSDRSWVLDNLMLFRTILLAPRFPNLVSVNMIGNWAFTPNETGLNNGSKAG